MTQTLRLIEQAAADGVRLNLLSNNKLEYEGPAEQVQKWLAPIQRNKDAIRSALRQQTAEGCQISRRMPSLGDGGPSGGLGALLNLPAVEAAPAVYLTASVADAEAIERLGRVATTLDGGAWEAVAKQAFVVDLPADGVAAWIEQGGHRNELMRLTREAAERSIAEPQTLKGVALKLYVDELKDTVWIVDEEDAERLGEPWGTVYTREEATLLASIDDPEIVRQFHALKSTFNLGKPTIERFDK